MKKALTIGLVAILVLAVFVTGASAATILPGLKTSAPGEVDCVEEFTVISEGTAPIFEGITPIPKGITPIPKGITPIPEGTAPIFEGVTPIFEGITPISKGTAPIFEGTGTPITSTGWPKLSVSTSAPVVDCGEAFTVTVTCNGHPIGGAYVFLNGDSQGITAGNGELICTIVCGSGLCPNVITAKKPWHIRDSTFIWLTKLEIEAPDIVTQGVEFTIRVTAHGDPVEGARVWGVGITCNGHTTDEYGKVSCSTRIDGPFNVWIKARKSGYYCPSLPKHIYSVPPGNPTQISEDITTIPEGTTPIFEGITTIPEGRTPTFEGTAPIFEGTAPISEGTRILLTRLAITAPFFVTQGEVFTITVTAYGDPVEGATVSSVLDTCITCYGQTDENGDVNCIIEDLGLVSIIATKMGYWPSCVTRIYSVKLDSPTLIPEGITTIPEDTAPIFEGITTIPEGTLIEDITPPAST